jgi:hypothetical protein
VEVTDRVVAFVVPGPHWVVVPRSAFADEEAFQDFVAEARRLRDLGPLATAVTAVPRPAGGERGGPPQPAVTPVDPREARRKGLQVLLVVGLGAAAVAAVLWFSRPVPGVTRGNFQRLHGGMTERQAEAILGSAGDREFGIGPGVYKTWQGEGFRIVLEFSDLAEDAKVTHGWLLADDGQVLGMQP